MAKQRTSEALATKAETAILAATTMGMGKLPVDDAVQGILARNTRVMPKVHSLKEPGEFIDGQLLRQGADIEITRPDGEVVAVKTWVFEVGQRLQVALMSSYQLDHELPALIGSRVRITFASEQRTNAGQRVKDYYIEQYQEAEVTQEDEPAV